MVDEAVCSLMVVVPSVRIELVATPCEVVAAAGIWVLCKLFDEESASSFD